MAEDVAEAILHGAPETVFDLVTQGRWWKEWHVSSTGVGGVTERPFLLGDTIQETGEVGPYRHQLSWTVVEHERPRRAVLHEPSFDAYLVYTFDDLGDGTVRYRRDQRLENPDALRALGQDPDELLRLTAEASIASVRRLEQHINGILAAERQDLHAR